MKSDVNGTYFVGTHHDAQGESLNARGGGGVAV